VRALIAGIGPPVIRLAIVVGTATSADLALVTAKLDMISQAVRLDDLRAPPANRLEKLKGDRAGQYSIRINDQFRVCFNWTDACATEVEITDYH
jgi:toxin HigB-1